MKEETKNNGHLVITNPWQKEQEIKITVPEGYEIDKENSTFECIKLKKKDDIYRHKCQSFVGYYITRAGYGQAYKLDVTRSRYENYFLDELFLFNTEKQAKSAVAMSKISQIMANDERFGGVITDEEWPGNNTKYTIERLGDDKIAFGTCGINYNFLAFHTKEQRDLFLEENEDLVKDYLMID
jgi:hypothetical protein